MTMQLDNIRNIAIFRALQLGDLLCAIPAIRALRHHWPQANVTLVGLLWAHQLLGRFPHYFDAFEPFPGFPGLPEQPCNVRDLPPFLQTMQARKLDLALQMQGDGTLVNPLVELFGAALTAGFYTEANYWPNSDLFIPYPSHVHEVCRHLLLMQHLDVAHQGLDLEFPLTKSDVKEFEALELPIEPARYVCVHPGSRGACRQWAPQSFAHMADRCRELGYDVVITGTAEEMPIVNQVIHYMRSTPVIAAGKTSLGALAVLIKQAKAILSNCTGTSHLASALGTPGVVISLDGEPHRWRPLNKSALVTVDWIRMPDLRQVEDLLVNKLTLPLSLEQSIHRSQDLVS